MKLPVVLALSLVAIVGAACGYWWWMIGSIPPPVRLCEARIKDVLRSPASYERANYRYTLSPQSYSREDYVIAELEVDKDSTASRIIGTVEKYDPAQARQRVLDSLLPFEALYKTRGFTKVLVSIDFDARNPMGVLLRSTGICRWVKLGQEPGTITWSGMDADQAGVTVMQR